MSDERRVIMGNGNYNERIGGDYIQIRQDSVSVNQNDSQIGIGVVSGEINIETVGFSGTISTKETEELQVSFLGKVDFIVNQECKNNLPIDSLKKAVEIAQACANIILQESGLASNILAHSATYLEYVKDDIESEEILKHIDKIWQLLITMLDYD